MRVITGSARGVRLDTLEGNAVRPTADRVKEALFSAVQFQIEGSRVLDLFAGCGQLGIEALSRGAAFSLFCDNSKKAADTVRDNLERCGFEKSRYRVHLGDSVSLLNALCEKFDFCFLDPPYYGGLYDTVLESIYKVMNVDGTVFCEHPADIKLKDVYGSLVKVKDYRFGKIIVTKFVLKGCFTDES